MTTTVRAVYEKGTLHLDAPLPLAEGESIGVALNLPEPSRVSRKRFSWEDGPILLGDGTNSLTDELRRQHNGD